MTKCTYPKCHEKVILEGNNENMSLILFIKALQNIGKMPILTYGDATN